MQTAAPAPASSTKVAATVPHYAGPLGRFLARQDVARATAALDTMRANIMGLVEDPNLFSEEERTRATANVASCLCLAQLQRWFRNVYRLLKQRENSLHMGFINGTYTRIPVAA